MKKKANDLMKKVPDITVVARAPRPSDADSDSDNGKNYTIKLML
jgi:hypothetical protein